MRRSGVAVCARLQAQYPRCVASHAWGTLVQHRPREFTHDAPLSAVGGVDCYASECDDPGRVEHRDDGTLGRESSVQDGVRLVDASYL